MKYHYEIGAVRWCRANGDPRGHRTPEGWDAVADMLEFHPITGKPYERAVWWVRENLHGRVK